METIGSIITSNLSGRYTLLNAKINGFTQIPNSFLACQDINIYEKMMIIIIKKYKMKNPFSWPAIKTIADEMRCSETTVKKTTKSLENKRLLIKKKDSRYRSNVYYIEM